MLTSIIAQVIQETIELMKYHRDAMVANWDSMAVEKIQTRWCGLPFAHPPPLPSLVVY